MIASNFYELFRKAAFHFDPELVHNAALFFLANFPQTMAQLFGRAIDDPQFITQSADGKLNWRFPIGVAAGLDKDAVALDYFDAIGFGAVEVGTVTPLPQVGNDRPRIFRHPGEQSLRNSMGFPSEGMEAVYQRVAKYNGRAALGVNIGKNKNTPIPEAFNDYLLLYKKFAPVADYIVVNLSSPNTQGLRKLQSGEYLDNLLKSLAGHKDREKTPIFIKISPDLSLEEVDHIAQRVLDFALEGIIATNTTIDHSYKIGGMSGKYLYEKSKIIRHHLLAKYGGESKMAIIGAGGFSSFADCVEFWKEGGKFIQLYTSFIYQGPPLIAAIAKEL